jgi:hypothetical protein
LTSAFRAESTSLAYRPPELWIGLLAAISIDPIGLCEAAPPERLRVFDRVAVTALSHGWIGSVAAASARLDPAAETALRRLKRQSSRHGRNGDEAEARREAENGPIEYELGPC